LAFSFFPGAPGFGGPFGGFATFATGVRTGALTLVAIIFWAAGVVDIAFGILALIPIVTPSPFYSQTTTAAVLLGLLGIPPIVVGALAILAGLLAFQVHSAGFTVGLFVSALMIIIGILQIVLGVVGFVPNTFPINPWSDASAVPVWAALIGGIFAGAVSLVFGLVNIITITRRRQRAAFGRLRPQDVLGRGAAQFGFPGQFGGFPGPFAFPPFALPGQFPYPPFGPQFPA